MTEKSEFHSEYIICPNCKEEYGDAFEWVNESGDYHICDNCGSVLYVYAEHEVTYHSNIVSSEELENEILSEKLQAENLKNMNDYYKRSHEKKAENMFDILCESEKVKNNNET